MAYDGYLVKIGEYVFPMKHIAAETYMATPEQRLDLDGYRDNTGKLHREVAENRPGVVEFRAVDLTNKEVKEIFDGIRANYINEDERKVSVTYYLPETDSYCAPEEMYIPNMKFPIDYVEGNKVVYNPIAFTFIGY